jgi:hypothetical protein
MMIVFAVLDSKSLTYKRMKAKEYALTNINDYDDDDDENGDNNEEFHDDKHKLTKGLFSEFLQQTSNEKARPNHQQESGPVNNTRSSQTNSNGNGGGDEDDDEGNRVQGEDGPFEEGNNTKKKKGYGEGGIFPHWQALSELCDCVLTNNKSLKLLRSDLTKNELMNLTAHALYRVCFRFYFILFF